MSIASLFSCCDPNTSEKVSKRTRNRPAEDLEKGIRRLSIVDENGLPTRASPTRVRSIPVPNAGVRRQQQHRHQHNPFGSAAASQSQWSLLDQHSAPQETLPAYDDASQHELLLASAPALEKKESWSRSSAPASPATLDTNVVSSQISNNNLEIVAPTQGEQPRPQTIEPQPGDNHTPNILISDPDRALTNATPDPFEYRTVPTYWFGSPIDLATSDRSSIISIPSTHMTDLTLEPMHTGRTSLAASYTPHPDSANASTNRPVSSTPGSITALALAQQAVTNSSPIRQAMQTRPVARRADTDEGLRPPSYNETEDHPLRRYDTAELENHPVMADGWLQRLQTAARQSTRSPAGRDYAGS